ncbi:family 16 glycoside hydrolase [Candidatus Omnitrophota bacterium]
MQSVSGNTDPATIGAFDNTQLFFDGQVDDVRVYTASFTAEQAYDLYSSGADNYAYYRSITSGGTYEPVDGLWDDFGDGDDTGWTNNGGSWTVSSYEYVGPASGEYVSVAGDTTWTDYMVEMDFNMTSGNHASLIFRSPNINQFYQVEYYGGTNSLNGGNINLYKYDSGYSNLAVTDIADLSYSTWYHGKVIVRGSEMKIYLNDILLITHTDSSHSTGKAGVGVHNATVNFDNVKITPLNTAATVTDIFGGYVDEFRKGVPGDSVTTQGWTIENDDGFAATIESDGSVKLTHNPVDYNGDDITRTVPSMSKAIIEFDANISSGANSWNLQVFTNNGLFFCNAGNLDWHEYISTWESIATGVTENEWHHYKLIMDCPNQTVYYYIDGVYKTYKDDAITTVNLTSITFGDYGLMSGVIYNYIRNIRITPIATDKGDNQAPTAPAFYATDTEDGSSSHAASTWSADNDVDFGWTEPVSIGDDYYYYAAAVDSEGNETNMLENNGFEDGESNWECNAVYDPATDEAKTGSYSIKGTHDGSIEKPWSRQIVTVEIGSLYLVSAWIKSDLTAGTHYITTESAFSGLVGSSISGTTDWTYVQKLGTATTTTLNVMIYPHSYPDGTTWTDDLRVQKVTKHIVTTPITGYWWAANDPTPESGGAWVARAADLTATAADLTSGTGNNIYVKAEDGAGNLSTAKTFGPFYIDTVDPTGEAIDSIDADSSSQLTVNAATGADANSNLHSSGPYWFNETTGGAGATDSSAWQVSTAFVDTGLSENTQYTYQVKLRDNVGNETSYSATVNKRPPCDTPTGLTATDRSYNSVSLSVDTFPNHAADQSGYKFQNTTTTTIRDFTATTNTWTDTTSINGDTQYTYRVWYRNGDGTETAYQEITIRTEPAPADTACDKSASTWYQGDSSTEDFEFTSSNLDSGYIDYYRYIWDRSASTTVTGSDTQWSSGTLGSLTTWNSSSMYLHVLPYNASAEPGTQVDYGPFYFVETSRLLKHRKFFDEDGALINMD